jgi:osmotically-inducible protein OsmY
MLPGIDVRSAAPDAWTALLAATLATMASCTSPRQRPEALPLTSAGVPVPAPPDDTFLAQAVRRRIARDPTVRSGLDVRAETRIVTLLGEVDSLLAERRAVDLARNVEGVRAVIDRLSRTPSARPDGAVLVDVKRALADDPIARAYPLRVVVANGAVVLTGTVPTDAERTIAEDVVQGVPGVRNVDARVEASPGRKRSDDARKLVIERRLASDPRIAAELVTVEVHGSSVRLAGAVGTAHEKGVATADAAAVAMEVDAQALEVRPPLHDLFPRTTPPPRDDEIRAALTDALRIDPRITTFGIGATVEDGKATLFGDVAWPRARATAEYDARDTVGVREVDNRIVVRPSSSWTDVQLAAHVTAALRAEPTLRTSSIEVRAVAGDVLVEGVVASEAQRVRAVEIVSSIPGVRNVDVQLGVVGR